MIELSVGEMIACYVGIFFAGAIIGLATAALCNIAKRNDLESEHELRQFMEERKHAHWNTTRYYTNECSNCGHISMDKTNYCPDCGCRMDKAGE